MQVSYQVEVPSRGKRKRGSFFLSLSKGQDPHTAIIDRLKKRFPEWELTQYCITKGKTSQSFYRNRATGNPAYVQHPIHPVETGSTSSEEPNIMSIPKYRGREAVNSVLQFSQAVKIMEDMHARLMQMKGVRFIPPDCYICDEPLSLDDAFKLMEEIKP